MIKIFQLFFTNTFFKHILATEYVCKVLLSSSRIISNCASVELYTVEIKVDMYVNKHKAGEFCD
jgi:hypothetical protein